MVTTLIVIGIPVFLIAAVGLAALSLSTPLPEEYDNANLDYRATPPQPVVFVPTAWGTNEREPLSATQLVAQMESQLKRERRAAAAFAKDPSSESLWLN